MHEGRVIARAVAQHGKGEELKALRRGLVQPTRAEAGGQRAAAIYTLLGTAKLNRLDPELYLRHVLERIAEHPVNRLQELLPWNLVAPFQLISLKVQVST
jgi:hypothetical protein